MWKALKNRSGSYKDTNENKVVKQYADTSLGKRCYYSLIKTYFSKLPKDAADDVFYFRACSKKPKNPCNPWFLRMLVGRKTLNAMVSKIFDSVGIFGKTNHSLCVTGASRLFTAQVPEKIIQQRTGHRSLEALSVRHSIRTVLFLQFCPLLIPSIMVTHFL